MSKRRVFCLILLAVVVLLAVWFATLSQEAKDAIVGLVAGRQGN